tara:strand:+ start:5466 stop:5756 length:291 start_codon:yes stop_codon:yes gene_type:complete
MKIFTTLGAAIALLLGITNYVAGSPPPTVSYTHEAVPSKIVDKKKAEPIKVPNVDCIVSVGDEAEITEIAIEELMATCVGNRKWLKIKLVRAESTF